MAAPIDFYFDFSSPTVFRQHQDRRAGSQVRRESSGARSCSAPR